MPHAPSIPFFEEVLLFLVATVIVVPVFHRLKISPILGFLGVGVLAGPSGFGLVGDPEGVGGLAELGVMFLLFTIGLELAPRRLWAMRRTVFGLGALQALPTGILIGLIAWLWGNTPAASVIVGMALALSSTAIVLQLLMERKEISSPLGRASLGVLLFQDLLVIPLLFAVSVLTDQTSSLPVALGTSLLRALVGMAVIFAVGQWVLRPLLRLVAKTRSREVFMAAILLTLLVTAWATESAGLSLALGAFLAGMLLAETEFEHQVEIDIQPFRGLLLNLFFIAVGMNLDVRLVADSIGWIVPSVLGMVAIKAVIAALAAMALGHPRRLALRAALLLGPAGEFAFVVIGAALVGNLIAPDIASFMLVVAGLSMVLTPFAPELGNRLSRLVAEPAVPASVEDASGGELADHVVIAGYGRVGRLIGRILESQQVAFVALDNDITKVERSRRDGAPVFLGDASHQPLLARAGADRAAAIALTMNSPIAAKRALVAVRQHWPHVPVYVRAHDDTHLTELVTAGATAVIPETQECGRLLAAHTLSALGVPSEATRQLLDQLRQQDIPEGA